MTELEQRLIKRIKRLETLVAEKGVGKFLYRREVDVVVRAAIYDIESLSGGES